MAFVNYHKHSMWTNARQTDSSTFVEEYVDRIKQLKQNVISTVEHGWQGNVINYYELAKANNLKLLIGAEAYWVKDRKEKDSTNCHICLLAKNEKGRRALNKALTIANIDGFYYKPRMDEEIILSLPKDDIWCTSACFDENSIVTTYDNKYKKISEIKPNDKVLSVDGNWNKVITPTRRLYNGTMYDLRIHGCLEHVKCTEDHLFPCLGDGEIIWKKAKDLSLSDRVLSAIENNKNEGHNYLHVSDYVKNLTDIDIKICHNLIKENKILIDNDFLEILGLYTAEGNSNKNKDYLCFTLHEKETYLVDKINNFSLKMIGVPCKVLKKNSCEHGISVYVYSKILGLLFYKLIGEYSNEKHVPDFVMKLKPNLQMSFIKGLFEGDGCIRYNKEKHLYRLIYATVSRTLAYGVTLILERNGINWAGRSNPERIDKNGVLHQKSYYIEINSKKFLDYWKDEFLKGSDLFNLDWDNDISHKLKSSVTINGVKYLPKKIKEIKTYQYNGYVYCLNINNNHSFRIEGISVHNCLAFYKYGFDYSKDFVLKLHKHFGNNFYLELQTHNVDTQKEINKNILNWSKEYKINYICGLDSHYIYPEDSVKRNIYIESRGIRYPEEEQFILDFPDEKTIFDRFMLQGVLSEEEAINAIKNTYIFEDVEEYTGECFTKEIKMPVALKYKAMTTEQKENELKRIVYNEFDKYSKNFDIEKKKQYTDEIERNLSVIHEINHADYFLGNYEFIKRGKELGCMLSPTGRGSSVSFLVNFFLGFTKVDKMQSAIPLYAERFLSAKRVLEAKSLADIDHNSGYPDKLQLAMEEVYGKGHCYPLIAYGTMKDKGAWKMYARVNNIDFDIANSVSEQIDQYELDLKHASEDEKENIKIQDYISPEYYPIYEKSRGYLKLVNSLSVHPCANLLYSEDIIEEFGLILVKSDTNKKETLCVCADGAWIENYKFLKADLLKVDVSKLIYSLYNRIGGDVISIQDLLTLSEKHNAWDIYSRGITMGINQVEQEGSRQKVMRYKPRNIAELAAFVAAVRPGFKSLYKRFEERNRMSYGVESIDKLLESSNGMILYQENVMAILNYAGYDMSDCYTILKAIAKKKPEVLQKRKIEFHDMMINKLVNTEKIDNEKAEEITANIWQVIDDCSSYSFNSSHAMCVSLDGLYCALIKKVYPLIFYETYLNLLEENQDKDKIILAKEEASKYFNVLFPKPKFGDDNRKSVADMNNNSIITSLKSIKGFSTTTANELYKLGQYFKDKKSNFYNVLIEIENKKLKINTAHIEKLISIGYFSKYGSISCLTKFYICYQKIHGRKEFKISNEDKIPIKIEILKNFCGTETSKTLKNFNEIGFFEFLLNKLNSLKDDIKDVIFYENEYLGQIYTKDENAPDNLYYVEEVIFKKTIRSVLYHVKDGTHKTVKIRKKIFDEEPFTGNKMIKVYEIKQEPRYIYQGEDENGKPKFIKDYENMEDILKDYYIIE